MSTRHDGDSWDLASSVGTTATMAAAARAMATRADRSLIDDSVDTDMARLRYFGERNEAGPYLADRGWALTGISIRELFAANDLPALTDDGMRMGDIRYVSGIL